MNPTKVQGPEISVKLLDVTKVMPKAVIDKIQTPPTTLN